jgi:hypothetical protein
MDTDPMEDRLRFAQFVNTQLPDGHCRIRVELTHPERGAHTGECDGLGSETGVLRCSAQACVDALGGAVGGVLSFELLGVKAVRAFDATVVIVALLVDDASGQAPRRVVGSCLTEDDPPRAASLAVLNATNRLLGNRLFMR